MNDELLVRYISDKATPAECEFVLSWIEESEQNRRRFATLKNMWVATDIAALDEEQSKRVRINRITGLGRKIAFTFAKVACVAAVSTGVFFLGRRTEQAQWVRTIEQQYTEVNVPAGETTGITLPDGTTVRLNSGSSFRFSKNYGINDRRVSLDGEGYFDVVKNQNLQFTVSTSHLDINVLGTKFNMSAYDEDNSITASLFEGSIMVNNFTLDNKVILEPNQEYSFNKVSGIAQKHSLNAAADWRDNTFAVNGEDIRELAKRIERRFGVSVEIAKDVHSSYTGVFRMNNLTETLEMMKMASPIKYNTKDNEIYITKIK